MPITNRWAKAGTIALTLGAVTYSGLVLGLTASMGDVGARCVFGTDLREPIDSEVFPWRALDGGPDRPEVGDFLTQMGPPLGSDGRALNSTDFVTVKDYMDVVRGMKRLNRWRGEEAPEIEVHWRDREGRDHRSAAEVRDRPWPAWLRSLVWFLQQLIILGIGARVYWKRPNDDSARLFFVLCAITMMAYVGGYHWSEIVVSGPLIFLFAGLGAMMPAVNLHFYWLFPRPLGPYLRRRKLVLWLLYGTSGLALAALWGAMS